MKTKIPTLVRLDRDGEYILFFPNIKQINNRMSCWQFVGQHGEAHLDFVKECRNVTNSDVANAAIRSYVNSYPKDDTVEYVLIKRINEVVK